jgi:hypothetical protein
MAQCLTAQLSTGISLLYFTHGFRPWFTDILQNVPMSSSNWQIINLAVMTSQALNEGDYGV